MIKCNDLLRDMRKIVLNRTTSYNNSFPFNCGYIWPGGGISFDCIGLVKSYINQPDIVSKFTPSGYYVTPGRVIPDTTEIGILNLCSDVTWGNFRNCAAGEYLYMAGHGGIFVGDTFGRGSGVNVVECTTGWGVNGVVASWVDPDGTRRDQKGGNILGRWEAHGKLSKYVDYSEWYTKNGAWYHKTARGWLYDYKYNCWFLLDKNGKMLTGWQKVGNYWYYLCTKNDGKHYTGEMITGNYSVPCKFDNNGHWVS